MSDFEIKKIAIEDTEYLIMSFNTILNSYIHDLHRRSKLSGKAKEVVIGRAFNLFFTQQVSRMEKLIAELDKQD